MYRLIKVKLRIVFACQCSLSAHSLIPFVPSGADIVGVNCHFDPKTCVQTVVMMKEAVEKAGLKAHYMVQPLAYHTPDCGCQGFIDLPEFPFGKHSLVRYQKQCCMCPPVQEINVMFKQCHVAACKHTSFVLFRLGISLILQQTRQKTLLEAAQTLN